MGLARSHSWRACVSHTCLVVDRILSIDNCTDHRYALLGGKTKDRLPVYCTSARPDISKDLGFIGGKVPCPYGPSAGDEGFRKNVEFFKQHREKVRRVFSLWTVAPTNCIPVRVPQRLARSSRCLSIATCHSQCHTQSNSRKRSSLMG